MRHYNEGERRGDQTLTEEDGAAEAGEDDEDDEEDGEQTPADRAWDVLYDEWVALGPKFQAWWKTQGVEMRTSVVKTARDAVRAELPGEVGRSLEALCPELGDAKVTRITADHATLPLLVDVRLRDPDKAEEHDERFCAANASALGGGGSQGGAFPVTVPSAEEIEAWTHNRALVITNVFINVLVVAKQLGVSDMLPPPPPPPQSLETPRAPTPT